jgi:NadR type nicotinamide-nucleotide adenylyltransferase
MAALAGGGSVGGLGEDVSGSGPRRIVLIGPESTGKTWLAGELGAHYGVPWSPEYAREYVEAATRALGYEDVDPIGRGQKAGEDAALARAERARAHLVVHDTDLVSTAVYSRHYYGRCPAWIEREGRERIADLYLLHHADVGWVADGHQREQPERREELFTLFRGTLAALGARTIDVRGPWAERRQSAIEGVDDLLRGGAVSRGSG